MHVAAVEPAESAVWSASPADRTRSKVSVSALSALVAARRSRRNLDRDDRGRQGDDAPIGAGGRPVRRRVVGRVVASIHLGQRLGPGATVVTILVDSGLRNLSTDVFGADRPMFGRLIDQRVTADSEREGD